MRLAIAKTNTLALSRIAVFVMFMVHGAVFGNWASRIPAIQDKLKFSDKQLGFALLGISFGVLFALPIVGGLVGKYSSRRVLIIAAMGMMVSLPIISVTTSFWSLWAVLFFLGAATSSMDVAMNAQAVEVEKRVNRPIMSSFHASFSIGLAAGGLMGGAITAAEIGIAAHFLVAMVLLGGMALIFAQWLVDVDGEVNEGGSVFSLPHRAVWMLGIVGFASTIGEGAMADWSGVYLKDVVGATGGVVALGLVSFSGMMTVGRFMGDSLTQRFHPVTMVRAGGLLSTCGLLLLIFVPELVPALIGFAMVGAGLAAVIPLVFSAAGRQPGISSSVGIAGVATIGYAGFLAGPPVIGIISDATSLQVGMGIVAGAMLIMSLLAGALDK